MNLRKYIIALSVLAVVLLAGSTSAQEAVTKVDANFDSYPTSGGVGQLTGNTISSNGWTWSLQGDDDSPCMSWGPNNGQVMVVDLSAPDSGKAARIASVAGLGNVNTMIRANGASFTIDPGVSPYPAGWVNPRWVKLHFD
jgi:hypothetical protein